MYRHLRDTTLDRIVGLTKVGIYRSLSYLNDLTALGCIYLDKNFKLSINNDQTRWYLPVTITGTLAIERSLAGLHTIVVGRPWYLGMPGVIHIDELTDLRLIPQDWTVPDSRIASDTKEFIIAILDNKTISNAPGIGTGIKDNSAFLSGDFSAEINSPP